MTIVLVTLGILALLFGLTALAFRGGDPTKRGMDSAERGDGRGGDMTGLTSRHRNNSVDGA